MLKRESENGVRKGKGSYRTYSIPDKPAPLVSEFAVENLPSAEQHPMFLRVQRRTCPWAEHSVDMIIIIIIILLLYSYYYYYY